MVSLDRIRKLKENQQKIEAFKAMQTPVAKYSPPPVVREPEPPKQTFVQKVGNVINDVITTGPLGYLDKGARAFDEGISNTFKGTIVEQIGKDIMAGVGDANRGYVGALESVGLDKVPVVKDVLADIKQDAQNLSEQGGTGIGSQVVRSLPGAVSSMALAMMGGGATVPAQLGGNAVLQGAKNLVTNPAFANSMVRTYGGAYNEAREAGANRPTAITSALAQAIPQSLIEVSGGLEQLPAKMGKQSLLKTIGEGFLEEGMEEILQYPFEGLAKKATYAPETPVFSTKEQAVINPVQMAQHGLVGGIAGGLLGGGAKVVSDIPTLTQKVKAKMQQDTQTIKPSTPSNFEADTDTVSQYIQQAKDADIPQLTEDYIMKNWVADNAKTYRYAKPDDPMSDWGHAMFADDPTKYGIPEHGILDDSLYSVKKSDLTNISDLRDDIINQWNEDVEDGTAYNYTFTNDELSLSGEDIVERFDPKDIVDTAEAFDHPEFTQWLWDRVLEPRGIVGVKTKDGGIVFDPSIIQKESNLLIQATQPIDDIQQEAAPIVEMQPIAQPDTTAKTSAEYPARPQVDEAQRVTQGEPDIKTMQFDVISKSNPATDDMHTWIRSTNDIKTYQEALSEAGFEGDDFAPDYTGNMVNKALETGKITVYSSNPIENGIFVTPSKMEAQSYAGKGKVYSKEVSLDDVAWIDEIQGQYAPVSNQTKVGQVDTPFRLFPGEIDPLSNLNPPIQQQTQQQVQSTAQIQQATQPIDDIQQEAAPTVKTKQTIEKELVQKHKQAEQLRREYEQLRAASKLTPDELTIADNIRKGKLNPENIPQGMNAQVINDVANAGRLYDQVNNEIKDYNIQRKQTLYETMDSLLEDSDNAKDKAGWKLSRETPERNAIDVFGEKAGKRINETVFRPVHDNEARRTKFINEYVRKAKELNITNKKHKLDAPMLINGKQQHTLTESEAVQLVGEKKITLDDLPQTMDKTKIQNAVTEMRKWFDNFIRWANEVLVRNGYKPVDYRKDYFPHFDDPQDPFVKAMKAMGFKVDNITLPTDIAGITHQFRPGKKWFGHFLRREGTHTTYDALEGFERYLYGISDVIYHTDDIQRLRAFETAIRMKYVPDNIKNRIQEIRNSDLSPDEQQSAIDALFELDRGHLGNYVTDLRNYTDTLAGKKSISDRNMEHKLGRATYNFFDNMNTQVAKNMVGWNVSSWLTNFIPIAQAGGGIKAKNLLKATQDTVLSYINDDGFRDKSTFLTNRKGTERLTQSTIQKIADAGLAPMEFIDDIATQILVRGKYYDNIERGMSHQEAINNADDYTAGAVADRSKGAMPTAFYAKNPLTKLFTLFQLEVNNQYSFLFKDLPREAKELGGKWLAMTLLKAAVGSYIFNELFEKLAGRRPAPDLIGTVVKALKKDTPLSAIQSVAEDVLENTPFVGGVLDGGRLPTQAALPEFGKMWDTAKHIQEEGWTGENIWDFLSATFKNPLTYLVSPIGGGGQAKKTIEGIQAYNQGASLSNKGLMRFPIEQTPFNRLRTTLFGQYSTPEAREYFDKDRRTLSEKQTQQVMQSEDPKKEYENFLRQRQINRLKDQLKKATSEKEKAEIREQIKELRAAQ